MSNQAFFNTNIFSSYEKFQNYMLGKDEIKAIQAQAASGANIQISLAKKTAMVIKAPFNLIAAVFFSASAFYLSQVGAANLSVRCEILSLYFIFEDYNISKIFSFDKDLLVLSKNMSDPSTSDLYLTKKLERKFISKDERLAKLLNSNKMDESHEILLKNQNDPLAKKTLNDPLVKKNLEEFNKKNKDIDFGNIIGNSKGRCYGMSVWFAYLYLNSEQSSQDCLKHIVAVAKQFENGAPRQAGLLQSFFSLDVYFNSIKNLLKLKSEETISKDCEESHIFLNFLNKNQDGVYLLLALNISDIGHGICYIKENDHKYIFDPNVGLVKIDDEKTFQAFYDSQIKGKFKRVEMSKLMKDEPAIQAPKKASESPNILFRIAHLFLRIVACIFEDLKRIFAFLMRF